MKKDLRAHCHTIIAGNHEQSPAEHFYAMAKWCEEHQVKHDVYGDGEFINSFQQKVADLLGFEAGLFVITGTMTQATALELVCRKKRNPVVAMHESSHIYRFERQGYQLQNRFSILPLGDMFRPWTAKDLNAWPDEISAVLYELPMRELGGNCQVGTNSMTSKLSVNTATFTSIWMALVYGSARPIIKSHTKRLPRVFSRLMSLSIRASMA